MTELRDQGLHVSGPTVADDLEIGGIGADAGVLQGAQRQHEVCLGELQGEEMLAELHVVIDHAAQRVAVGLPRVLLIAGSWPRGGCDLDNDGIARIVPGHHSFRVTPAGTAVRGAAGHPGVSLELIVPDDVVEVAVVDLVVGGADGVLLGRAGAAGPLLELRVLAARENELLSATAAIRFGSAAERARLRPRLIHTTAGEFHGVELEHEPPAHRMTLGEERSRTGSGCSGGHSRRCRGAGDQGCPAFAEVRGGAVCQAHSIPTRLRARERQRLTRSECAPASAARGRLRAKYGTGDYVGCGLHALRGKTGARNAKAAERDEACQEDPGCSSSAGTVIEWFHEGPFSPHSAGVEVLRLFPTSPGTWARRRPR